MIRLMAYEDVDEVAALEALVFTDPWSKKVYEETIRLDETAYVVCEIDGRIVGMAGVRNICSDGEITNVCIHPEFRRRGYAKEMMDRLLAEGKRLGVVDFTLEVRASNTGAIKLYESFGFCSEGVRPGFYNHPKEDALIMWKRESNI